MLNGFRDTTQLFSHMGKLDLGKHSQWKVINTQQMKKVFQFQLLHKAKMKE